MFLRVTRSARRPNPDATGFGLRWDEPRRIAGSIDSERLIKARLVAEADGAELVFPEEVAARRPTIVSAQRQAFEARRRELSSTLQVMREQVKQRELEVEELNARTRAVESNLKLASERLRMSQSLLSEGLTARMEHLELEAEVENLDGESKSLRPALPKAMAAIEEARQRLQEAESRFRREAQDQLGKLKVISPEWTSF